MTPGQYTVETVTGGAAICCPKCGGISDLQLDVLIGGVVSSVWACPFVLCGLREFLVLESHGEQVLR